MPPRVVGHSAPRADEESPRVRALEEKVRLQQKLLESKNEIIGSLQKIITMYEKQAEVQAAFPLKNPPATMPKPGKIQSIFLKEHQSKNFFRILCHTHRSGCLIDSRSRHNCASCLAIQASSVRRCSSMPAALTKLSCTQAANEAI